MDSRASMRSEGEISYNYNDKQSEMESDMDISSVYSRRRGKNSSNLSKMQKDLLEHSTNNPNPRNFTNNISKEPTLINNFPTAFQFQPDIFDGFQLPLPNAYDPNLT